MISQRDGAVVNKLLSVNSKKGSSRSIDKTSAIECTLRICKSEDSACSICQGTHSQRTYTKYFLTPSCIDKSLRVHWFLLMISISLLCTCILFILHLFYFQR
jgi:hypothetical protein